MIEGFDLDDGDAAPAFKLRDYQMECLVAIDMAWSKQSRSLAVLGTGGGKTIIFANVAKREVSQGGRVLILAHTDELLEQAIDKLRRSTGLEADKEKADSHASPYANVVVASVQTLQRDSRLTSFSHDHFSLVIVDETHRVLAKSYLKILAYFHFGPDSMKPEWKMPDPGVNHPHFARVLGVTATPDRGDKRNLGEFYASPAVFNHGMFELCRDGYLVRPVVENIPLQIDIRGVKKKAGDYDATEVAHRIEPFLKEIARQISTRAMDRKTVVFTPSVETARMMASALIEVGVDASFVSGSCPDRHEKMEAYHRKGNGSAIANAMMLVEGWDHPEVSCIVPLRVTKIRSLLAQMAGRGTRPLPGVIDGLETVEERIAAIAASAKKDILIFDFLWLVDKMNLACPVDLFSVSPEKREAMLKSGKTDLLEAEEVAQRDLLKSLKKEAEKHKHRQARTVDPLILSMMLGDSRLANYVPETTADAAPPSKEELDAILALGLDSSSVKNSGQAQLQIETLRERSRLGLASPKMLQQLTLRLGWPEEKASVMKMGQAGALIGRGIRYKAAPG